MSQCLLKLVEVIQKARRDPSEFLAFCFRDAAGQRLVQSRVHRELQAFLTRHPRVLIELPRDHGKSMQVCGRILWELGRNPNLRIKLVCATQSLAEERSRFLRDSLARNTRLALIFPHLQPGEPWSAGQFTVVRRNEVIGPSVSASGVESGTTGARTDLLVCDDVVDVRSLRSQAERERLQEIFHNNLLNLLEPHGRFWGLFTPWHTDDLNAHLKRNSTYAHFRRAIGPNLEPVWPEKWPREALAKRRAEIGEAAFSRGYRLVPIHEGERVIRPEWVQFWNELLNRDQYETVVLSIDPALTAQETADASALVVLARLVGRNEIHVLEARGVRVTTPDLMEQIAQTDRQWQPDVIVFESNAAFAGIRQLLERHAVFGPRVVGVVQSRSKVSRVATLSVPVQNGTVRLRSTGSGVHPSQQELWDEMTLFPFAPHDDLVDALATGVEHLLRSRSPRIWV